MNLSKNLQIVSISIMAAVLFAVCALLIVTVCTPNFHKYTYKDIEVMKNVIVNDATTDKLLELYDFNKDGALDIMDVVILRKQLEGIR